MATTKEDIHTALDLLLSKSLEGKKKHIAYKFICLSEFAPAVDQVAEKYKQLGWQLSIQAGGISADIGLRAFGATCILFPLDWMIK